MRILLAAVFVLLLAPAVAQADDPDCPPPQATVSNPTTPPPATPPGPPAPTPAPPATPTPPQQVCPVCPVLCTSRRVFTIRLREVAGRISSATVQVLSGTQEGPLVTARRQNGRLRARVDFRGLEVRKGEIIAVRIVYTRDGRKQTRYRLYRSCRPNAGAFNKPILI